MVTGNVAVTVIVMAIATVSNHVSGFVCGNGNDSSDCPLATLLVERIGTND